MAAKIDFNLTVSFLTTVYKKRTHQELSGRVLEPKGRGFEPHRRHCVVSLSKNINPSLVPVQPRKTRPFITERLLMGCKESNQTNKNQARQQVTTKITISIIDEYHGHVFWVLKRTVSSKHFF